MNDWMKLMLSIAVGIFVGNLLCLAMSILIRLMRYTEVITFR
jgi:hypothetical protein